jgi:D-erythronate 2-dehydrogenase
VHVVVTGANGFIGRALAGRLAADRRLGAVPIECLTLIDLAFDAAIEHGSETPVVQRVAGDLGDAAWLARVLGERPVDAIFHLASIPGGLAEQQYTLARRVNLDATTVLLECGKAQVEAGGRAPVVVFASSIAVFGRMPSRVDDTTLPSPLLTYGAHKLIGETLVADFSRRGWVDGCSLRLPGVLARPPARTGQLSAFLSDLIREPAAGRAMTCPASPDATTWASSLPCVVGQLLHAAAASRSRPEAPRTLTLPTLRFSMAELLDALAAVHGERVRSLVRWEPDARIEALFGRFPPLATPAADALGFGADADLVALVRASVADTPTAAVPMPTPVP